MTKIIAVVLFSLLGYAVANPTCTDEQANKCVPNEGDADFLMIEKPWVADDGNFTQQCPKVFKVLDCGINFAASCFGTPYGTYFGGLLEFKILFARLCEKSAPIRADYLQHVSCLNDQIAATYDECYPHIAPDSHASGCKTAMTNYKTCLENGVRKNCEAKAVDLLETLYAPRVNLNTAVCEHLKH